MIGEAVRLASMTETFVGAVCAPEEFDDNLKLDFSSFVKKKGSISYLPWAEIVRTLHKKVPLTTYGFKNNEEGGLVHYTPDGGAYFRPYLIRRWEDKDGRVLKIVETPPGFFPCSDMRARHKALTNPNIRDIDNTLRRAIAKEIGLMTGIGLQLWCESDPYDLVDEEEPCVEPKATRGVTSSSTGLNGSKTSAGKTISTATASSEPGTKPSESPSPIERLDQAALSAGLISHGKQTVAVAVKADSWDKIPAEKMPKIISLLGNKDHVKLLNDGRNTSGKVINPRDKGEEMRELAAAFRESES